MTGYLYVLSIGPVQDFIKAARTTRDLWFGSHLLSEVSKAAAKEIADSEGLLIFPALNAGDENLNPSDKSETFNVANVILARLPEGSDPSLVNNKAQKAATKRWKDYANEAKHNAGMAVWGEIWNEQVDDVIDFYSAWVPLGNDYSASWKRVMRLLNGSKSIRNFVQPPGRAGVPKSSLDGARESVLKKDLPEELIIRMRLANNEQLCAVGLTKRLGGENVFPSVVRVAADPWIRGIFASEEEPVKILKEISGICKGNPNIASQYSGNLYRDFPYDCDVLFPSQLGKMMKIPDKTRDNQKNSWERKLSDSDRDALSKIMGLTESLQKSGKDKNGNTRFGLGEPDPYLAILVADGDRMGRIISARKSLEDHREFSARLAAFAGKARRIVENNHHGCLIYSGGDDALAFLPVDTCLEAARDLHDVFGNLLENFPDNNGHSPTLSVGIAIGHSQEPLEDLLGYGRAAERAAKNLDRNGLAVHYHTRSGGDPIRVREQWESEGKEGLDERLSNWARMHYEEKLPDKAAYDIRELAKDYRGWKGITGKELGKLIAADAKRLLRRKKAGGDGKSLTQDQIDGLLNCVDSYETIRGLADQLILARKLAGAMRQSEETVQTGGAL
jgi:CRISPR-associated protein Cmr2